MVDGLDEDRLWVLGYGPERDIAEPAELRERVADLARKTLSDIRKVTVTRRDEVLNPQRRYYPM